MTVLVLDGSAMATLGDLHEQVARHPETPDWHGGNLDALFDVLVAIFRPPLEIRWEDATAARANMGPDFERARNVFTDAAAYLNERGASAHFEMIEGPTQR